MNKIFFGFFIILTSLSCVFSAQALQIDEKINQVINPLSTLIVSTVFFSVEIFEGIKVPLIVVWLIVAAIFCTVYFGFINISLFISIV